MPPERAEEVLEILEVREKQYDKRIRLDLYDDNGDVVVRDAVTYIATGASENLNWLGEASIEEVAETIATALDHRSKLEYLLNLAGASAASEFTTRTWTSLSGG